MTIATTWGVKNSKKKFPNIPDTKTTLAARLSGPYVVEQVLEITCRIDVMHDAVALIHNTRPEMLSRDQN